MSDHFEVQWGLGAMSILRFVTGFLGFLLVFALRSEEASLGWYGAALAGTALGSFLGLAIVTRTHGTRADTTLLTWSHVLVALGCGALWFSPSLVGQVALSIVIGLVGSMAQPSFDSITQQYVPMSDQGRSFARFAVRQQLAWVVGAMLPVAIEFALPVGNALVAVICVVTGFAYGVVRRFLNPQPPRR
jgi:Na+/melibiose symporter-like transporter